MHISDILQAKGREVVVIDPDATVADLVALLTDRNLGAVVVSTDGVAIEGIVSERDVVRRLAEDRDLLVHPVRSLMTVQVHTCHPQDSVEALMTTMTEQRIRHLPVVDDAGHLAGLVSIGDMVKSHITQLEFERDQLQGYVLR